MKKQLLLALALMCAGQVNATSKAENDLKNLYNAIHARPITKPLDQLLRYQWRDLINNLTQYSIKNSRNYINQEDHTLVLTAKNVVEVNNSLISLYDTITNNVATIRQNKTLQADFAKNLNEYKEELLHIYKNIDERKHSTSTRQSAQAVLRSTINYLIAITDIIKLKIRLIK
jgi:hypothetical protein